MRLRSLLYGLHLQLAAVSGFWDEGTSTMPEKFMDDVPRQSFFRWQETQNTWVSWFYPWADWPMFAKNRRTICIGGISIGKYEFVI